MKVRKFWQNLHRFLYLLHLFAVYLDRENEALEVFGHRQRAKIAKTFDSILDKFMIFG